MREIRWTINYQDYVRFSKMHQGKNLKNLLRKLDVAEQAYYEGFKPGREKVMFEQEIDDIEKVYEKIVKDVDESIEDILPSLLHYMELFVQMHAKKDSVAEKLATLKVKLGKDKKEEKEDE